MPLVAGSAVGNMFSVVSDVLAVNRGVLVLRWLEGSSGSNELPMLVGVVFMWMGCRARRLPLWS